MAPGLLHTLKTFLEVKLWTKQIALIVRSRVLGSAWLVCNDITLWAGDMSNPIMAEVDSKSSYLP